MWCECALVFGLTGQVRDVFLDETVVGGVLLLVEVVLSVMGE